MRRHGGSETRSGGVHERSCRVAILESTLDAIVKCPSVRFRKNIGLNPWSSTSLSITIEVDVACVVYSLAQGVACPMDGLT
jgi:hypothetical protein